MKHIFLVIQILLILVNKSLSQNYLLQKYNDEHGLNSNLTKSLDQDSDGYLWIATDAGLAGFDGKKFINVIKNFPSLFVKDVLTVSKDTIIVVTDLGVGYLKNDKDGYYYQPIIQGKTEATKEYLYYPKAVFLDSKHNIWISDNNGITKLFNNKYKKYFFDNKYATDDYLNSFYLTEDDKGNIFISSWQGYLFYYDKNLDKFIEIPIKNKTKKIFINQFNNVGNYFLAATSDGIIRFDIDQYYTATMKLLLPFTNSVCFAYANNKYYLGGVEGGIFEWDGFSNKAFPISNNNVNSIVNYLFTDANNNIWGCTDEGIFLLQKTFFAEYKFSQKSTLFGSYITTIVNDKNDNIYFTDQEDIYLIPNGDYSKKPVIFYKSLGKRIYNFALSDNYMWISTRSDELFLKTNKTIKKFTLPNYQCRISGMVTDENEDMWGFIVKTNVLLKVSPNFNYKLYNLPKYVSSESIIKYENKNINIVSYSDKFHILSYDKAKDTFIDLPIDKQPDFKTSVIVNDFCNLGENKFLIATNWGLFLYENKHLSKFFNDDKEHNIVGNAKAVKISNNNKIWIGTEKGLVLYYNKQFIFYGKIDGLPNTVISPRAIILDNKNRIWLGTGSGVAYWQKEETDIKQTPRPILLGFNFNNTKIELSNKIELTGKGTINISYSSIVYPADKKYKWRLIGFNEDFSDETDQEFQSFNNLSPGFYVFQVKAKQVGFLDSEIAYVSFTIYPPWYQSDLMIIFYFIIGILAIIYGTLFWQKKHVAKLKRQKEILEKLVEEKIKDLKIEKEKTEKLLLETENINKELRYANEQLLKANEFKSDILGIAAHDLKNPLSTILSLTELLKDREISCEDKTELLEIISSSASRMLNLITELLENIIVENTKFKVNISDIYISELVNQVVESNRVQANKKGQTIHYKPAKELVIDGDEKWIREILDNVINNAVKYTPLNKNIYIDLEEETDNVIIKVKDEGPGFTEEDKKYVFQKFKKLSAKPTGGESTTGLGLAIVKQLIGLHNGEIELKSNLNEGSTFIIKLKKHISIN